MEDLRKRTWAEVSLENIRHNFLEMKKRLPENGKFLGVVKANAYGHGAFEVAKTLEESGCDYLAVAFTGEAIKLRCGGIKLPILILGHTDPSETETLIDYDITAAVNDLSTAEAMSMEAVRIGKKLKVHLKADSGMGRLGFTCHHGNEPDNDMLAAMKLPGLDIEGIFTHFAVSDEPDMASEEYTNRQFCDFTALCDRLEQKSGIKFKIRHCTNSGAMLKYNRTYLDMVRPGIILYGVFDGEDTGDFDLRPAMELKTRIYQIKEFAPDYSVSYGRTYMTDSPRRIAVIPVGYADGLHRVLSNKIEVLVRGKRAPQVGRICMDMCMIDVTDIPEAEEGDVVTIFGRDGESYISVAEQAKKAGTISYELLCSVSERVPRVYD